MSLKKLAKESLVYGLSRYVSKFIAVFLLPLYTAALSPEDYGILELLGTISLVTSFLIISGTDSAIGYYYFRKEYEQDRPAIISSSLIIRMIFSFAGLIIITTGSGFLSEILFGKNYSLFVIVTGITIVFSSVHSFLFDLLRLEFRAWLYTALSVGNIILSIILSVYYILILKQGVWGAILAQSITYGVVFVFTIIYVFKRYSVKYSHEWIKRILKYGFPLIGTGIAIWILGSTDRYFLAHYVDLSSVGIYAVGAKLASIIGLLAGALQLAWGPYAMGIQYQENAKQIYSKVFILFFVVNILAVFFISMFSIDILKVFTQPNYYSAKAVVPFLCLSSVFMSGYFIVSIGINITKKLQHTIWITAGAAVFNIILNFLMTPVYGVMGASFSIMTANLLIFLLTLIVSQKYYYIPFSFQKIVNFTIPALIIVTLSYYYNFKLFVRISLSLLYSIFGGIYLYRQVKQTGEYRKVIEAVKNVSWKKLRSQQPHADV